MNQQMVGDLAAERTGLKRENAKLRRRVRWLMEQTARLRACLDAQKTLAGVAFEGWEHADAEKHSLEAQVDALEIGQRTAEGRKEMEGLNGSS